MKKLILLVFVFFIVFSPLCEAGFWKKKEKPTLFLTNDDPRISTSYDEIIKPEVIFPKGKKIYFTIYSPDGFKSKYIKYQIIKQDNNAHELGYSRVKNKTVQVQDKNSYTDYFILHETGKYALQVFDITNLHQWLAIISFRVIDE